MNRKQRRAAKKATPAFRRKTPEQKLAAICKNGITIADLEENYKKGFDAGFKAAVPATYKTIYAAILLALKKVYRFGRVRGLRALRMVDDIVINFLTSEEAIDQVYEEMGVYLDFNDGIDRVKEADNG